ncbi:hypothetical protein GCM10010377_66780 [Streptomyces viridiviolaceus]|nr:hypothetical protein GCM10010377_66780 [Streptomyces viridiviolaceus]
MEEPYEPLRVDPRTEADRCERLAVLRSKRDNGAVDRPGLPALRRAGHRQRAPRGARGPAASHALRDIWGVHVPHDTF